MGLAALDPPYGYVKETSRDVPAFQQVMNREGTLMYWHPAHERAYINCLTAFQPLADGAQIVVENADAPLCLHMVAVER